MRFQVPQFIETEEKIIGPLTLKQFFWIGGGGALLFIIFVSLIGFVVILLGLPIALISIAMAFVKIQEVPLPVFIFHAIKYLINQKKYLYK